MPFYNIYSNSELCNIKKFINNYNINSNFKDYKILNNILNYFLTTNMVVDYESTNFMKLVYKCFRKIIIKDKITRINKLLLKIKNTPCSHTEKCYFMY